MGELNSFAENDIQRCLEVLRKGGVILYPTDTIWGLGCDARNENAVARIYDIKRRSDTKSLIVLVDNENMLLKHVSEVPAVAWDLIEYSERPLTIIYEKAFGYQTYDSLQAVRTEDLYDIASVTKIAATALGTMKLFDSRSIDINKPLSKYLPALNYKIGRAHV